MRFRFEWDSQKAQSNRRKHGISFEEAQTAFFDENGLQMADPDTSGGEERFILLAMSSNPRLVVVCHCYRKGDSIIRLISARKATKLEQRQYWEHLK